jgi:60 kDa SS-A/Ro ribonucleoprotein
MVHSTTCTTGTTFVPQHMKVDDTVPQTAPLREVGLNGQPRTAANSAGGQSFVVDDTMRLLRFLILGSGEGTYYAKPKAHTAENLAALLRLMQAGRGVEAVATIREVSVSGRAPRQTPTLTALALCAMAGDAATKAAANAALPAIARIPTHLFEYLELCEGTAKTMSGSSGWGRAHRRAVASWYNNHRGASAKALAESVTKYQQRNGWSHLDALRLCHAAPKDRAHATVFAYIVKGMDAATAAVATPETTDGNKRSVDSVADCSPVLEYLGAVEAAKRLHASPEGEAAMAELITRHRLVREHVPSELLSSVPVWTALLEGMPMTAMIRSLAKLTSIGLVAPGSEAAALIVARLGDADALRKARVHPMAVLLAHRTYSAGRGEKGSLTWQPAAEVVDALDGAFELAFASVVPANKRTMLALDVSGSMGVGCNGGGYGGAGLSCAEASAAMAVVAMRTEPECTAMCFSHVFDFLPITKETGLTEAMRVTSGRNFGMTDCSLPMQYALERAISVDTFIVYTDSETYHGSVHPCEALRKYREASGICDAKLIVVGMASNGFSIADPSDPGMLDVVGFDASAPQVMADFAAGRV